MSVGTAKMSRVTPTCHRQCYCALGYLAEPRKLQTLHRAVDWTACFLEPIDSNSRNNHVHHHVAWVTPNAAVAGSRAVSRDEIDLGTVLSLVSFRGRFL